LRLFYNLSKAILLFFSYFIPAAAAAINNTGRIFLNILEVFKIRFHEQHHGPVSGGSLHVPVTPEHYSIDD